MSATSDKRAIRLARSALKSLLVPRVSLPVLFGLLAVSVLAQLRFACGPVSARAAERVRLYVAGITHFGADQVRLTAITSLPDSCMHRLAFSIAGSTAPVAVVLSPDQHYLVQTVADLALSQAGSQLRAPSPSVGPVTPPQPIASLGDPRAPVTIVEFADFQCPFCGRLAIAIRNEIEPKYGSKVRLVFRNFPLSIHPAANDAAVAAACIAENGEGAFWAFHDSLFNHQESLNAASIEQAATTLLPLGGPPKERFHRCMGGAGLLKVESDIHYGEALGVRETPTLFVNSARLEGFNGTASLESAIGEALQKTHGSSIKELN